MAWNSNLRGGALQFAASNRGRIRCLAGPGTGKTFALMRRVQRLLEETVDPARILVVTLTRTAADDLRGSLKRLGVQGAENVQATTLHALCFSFLARESVFKSTGRITRVLSEFEKKILLRDIAPQVGTFTVAEQLLRDFSAAWAAGSQSPGAPPGEREANFEKALISELTWHQCMLLDEILPLARSYLLENPYASELSEFHHVLVDEYQDLNRADQEVVDLLSRDAVSTGKGQVGIIGDDDQSIYVLLRHAFAEGIGLFSADEDVQLVECLRCPKRVVMMAESLISRNPGRLKNKLLPCPTNIEGEIHNVVFESMEEEANGIATFIDNRIKGGTEPGDILVLANWRNIGQSIREKVRAFGHEAHSYFYEEAADNEDSQRALTLLTLLADPTDRFAVRAWLALSDRSENRKPYAKLLKAARSINGSVLEIIRNIEEGKTKISRTATAIKAWNNAQKLLAKLNEAADAGALIEILLPPTNPNLRDIREAASRALTILPDPTNIKEFVSALRREISVPEVPLNAPFVRVMSLHKSKGLTAKVVVIAGLVQGLIPRNPKKSYSPQQLAEHGREQRRMFFVGLTRSKETLVLSKFQKVSFQAALQAGGISTGRFVGPKIRQANASQYLQDLGRSLPTAVRGKEWLDQLQSCMITKA